MTLARPWSSSRGGADRSSRRLDAPVEPELAAVRVPRGRLTSGVESHRFPLCVSSRWLKLNLAAAALRAYNFRTLAWRYVRSCQSPCLFDRCWKSPRMSSWRSRERASRFRVTRVTSVTDLPRSDVWGSSDALGPQNAVL